MCVSVRASSPQMCVTKSSEWCLARAGWRSWCWKTRDSRGQRSNTQAGFASVCVCACVHALTCGFFSHSDFAQKLSMALSYNPTSTLHTLNLSNNSLEDKGQSARTHTHTHSQIYHSLTLMVKHTDVFPRKSGAPLWPCSVSACVFLLQVCLLSVLRSPNCRWA